MALTTCKDRVWRSHYCRPLVWPATGNFSGRALSDPLSSPRTRPDREAESAPFWRLERWQSGRMHRTRNAVVTVLLGLF